MSNKRINQLFYLGTNCNSGFSDQVVDHSCSYFELSFTFYLWLLNDKQNCLNDCLLITESSQVLVQITSKKIVQLALQIGRRVHTVMWVASIYIGDVATCRTKNLFDRIEDSNRVNRFERD